MPTAILRMPTPRKNGVWSGVKPALLTSSSGLTSLCEVAGDIQTRERVGGLLNFNHCEAA